MIRGDGEILACRAAQAVGIPYTLSTMSVCSIEDVAAAVEKPFWFQLYVVRDRGFVRELIERARQPMQRADAHRRSAGVRPAPLRYAERPDVPPAIRPRNLLDFAAKPAWALSILKGLRKTYGDLADHVKGMEDLRIGSSIPPSPGKMSSGSSAIGRGSCC